MIRTTLKEYLSAPNPPLCLNKKTHHATYTTESIAREPLEGKAEWPDFEIECIQNLFSTVLSQPFDLPAHPTLPPAQLRVRDERCFESVLLSHNSIIVNAALMAATNFMNLPSVTWLVGSYAEQVIDRGKSFPDWAGISGLDPRLNILPIKITGVSQRCRRHLGSQSITYGEYPLVRPDANTHRNLLGAFPKI